MDMGITSRTFNAANYGITGPHDGYIFMSAPRGTTYSIQTVAASASVATLSIGTHPLNVGDKIYVEDLTGANRTIFNGMHTITAKTSTTVSFATTSGSLGTTTVTETASLFKQYGNGNLVFATDMTGLTNNIVFAAGGYNSGNTQMTIVPDVSVNIAITGDSTSATTGALRVSGGIGSSGKFYGSSDLKIEGIMYGGVGSRTFGATLTHPMAVYSLQSLASNSYDQFAIRGQDATSSTDLIIYPDNGTDTDGWIDVGITGSNFDQTIYGITGKNDGYIFMDAPVGTAGKGNLVLATGSNGSANQIVFAAGGFASGRQQMVIVPDVKVDINIATPSTSATTGALVVHGGVGITGNVNIAGNITFGGSGTQVSTANLAVVAPLVFTGSGSTSANNDLGLITEGKYTITNIPVATVVNKQLVSNVATLITSVAHNFAVDDSVTVASIDSIFNGTYTITAVPSTTSFQFAKTNVDVASTRIGDQTFTITNKALVSNIAILQTSTTHTYIVGNSVTVTGVDSTFNGTYTITAVSSNTFSYAKTYTNVTSTSSSGTAVVNTSASTALVSSATRTRWAGWTKRYTDNTWTLVSNISTLPTTAINYSQNTYSGAVSGGALDLVYDKAVMGGLTIQGSSALYGAPYGSLIFAGSITSPAWTTTGIRHVGSASSTLIDTTSSGTVAAAYTNTFGSALTIAASSATTYTVYANNYFANPTAGSNVTITNPYGTYNAGNAYTGGRTDLIGNLNVGATLNSPLFTVAAATGNTVISGTLGTTGLLTATGGISAGGTTIATSTGNTTVAGTLTSTGLITTNGGITIPSGQTLTSNGTLTINGGASFSGTTDVQELREQTVDVTLASGTTGTLDWSAGNIYYVGTAPTGNMTLNVTNVPTDNSRIMTINVFVVQGATGYIPTTFQIAGSGQTIRWPGGTAPTPTSTSGKIDIFSFTMQRTSGGAWIVYGTSSLNY